jgi:hypothetical protein
VVGRPSEGSSSFTSERESTESGRGVGRERELSLAEGFLGSAGERFSVLVLEGEAGIGKTTV